VCVCVRERESSTSICAMTHSYAYHESSTCGPRLGTWLIIHMCAMTHSHMWHDSLLTCAPWLVTCGPWLIFICVPWRKTWLIIYVCAMTELKTLLSWHTFWIQDVCNVESFHIFEWVMAHMWINKEWHASLRFLAHSWHTCHTLQHTL